nr:M23 family metallopeptidase [Arthrobacter roseus]
MRHQFFTVAGSVLALAGLVAGSTIAEPAAPLGHVASANSPDTDQVHADDDASVDFQRTSSITSESQGTAGDKPAGPATVSSSIEPTGLSEPLASAHLASFFGTRANPLGNTATDFHRGVDYSGACGAAVLASDDGVVAEAGWHPFGGGQRVVVEHGDGMKTTYNHLSAIGVAVGEKLTRGATLGAIGSTGNSTGCHLHFEVMVNDNVVDPLGFL